VVSTLPVLLAEPIGSGGWPRQVAGGKAMKLVVMSPLELGEKLTELEIKDDWTVGRRPGEDGKDLHGRSP